MFTLTLEINQKCNLNCKYCYLGEINDTVMCFSIAAKAVDIAFDEAKFHKDKKLLICFVGGEPLLDFKLIKNTVEYSKLKLANDDILLDFSITTNGTVLSRSIVDYLILENFSLKISLDGTKLINDINRISKHGYSVHDRIIENMPLLREYEKRSGNYVQLTNVITGNNYEHYFESLYYLTKVLEFKIIDTALDLYYDWNNEEINTLKIEMVKCLDYLSEELNNDKGFYWSFADELININEKFEKFYVCGAGIISYYVRTNGDIHACAGNLDFENSLGNIKGSLNNKKICTLKSLNHIENTKCNECEFYHTCTEKSCIMENLSVTGSIHNVVPILCEMRKFKNYLMKISPGYYKVIKDNYPD